MSVTVALEFADIARLLLLALLASSAYASLTLAAEVVRVARGGSPKLAVAVGAAATVAAAVAAAAGVARGGRFGCSWPGRGFARRRGRNRRADAPRPLRQHAAGVRVRRRRSRPPRMRVSREPQSGDQPGVGECPCAEPHLRSPSQASCRYARRSSRTATRPACAPRRSTPGRQTSNSSMTRVLVAIRSRPRARSSRRKPSPCPRSTRAFRCRRGTGTFPAPQRAGGR